jgi:polysaccharide biosynthesis/export protein
MQINSNLMWKLRAVSFLIMAACASLNGQQDRKTPPKELVQYIRDASRLGLKDAQIQQNAVSAGWSAEVITASIEYVRAAEEALRTTTPRVETTTKPVPADKPPTPIVNPPTPQPQTPAAEPIPQAATESRVDSQEEYYIGAGDVLNVSVWKEPEASVAGVVVRPDGKIGLPLLKEVEVIGLTPTQVEKLITQRLDKLIPAADVTVVVTTIRSKKIYIVGAVNKEGPIPFTYRMTVMQAISEAGGLNAYAKRKKIYILRTENGKDYKLPFDYEAALRGERMELNIPLQPGDTLVVPN